MSDGLSQLAKRGRRTREIPPPRHPAQTARNQLTSVPEPGSPAEPAEPQADAIEKATPDAPEPVVGVATPAPKADLKVVTVHLEQDDDDFLETITHTSRTSRPKTAISRSAVVRLALERLHAQMSPTEIVNELRPRGHTHGTGRKRR